MDNCLKLSLLNTKATVEFLLRNVTSVSQRQMMKKIPAAGMCRADATNDAQIYRLNNHCQPLAESVTTNNPVLTHARATYVSNSPNWPPLMTVSTDRPTDRPTELATDGRPPLEIVQRARKMSTLLPKRCAAVHTSVRFDCQSVSVLAC